MQALSGFTLAELLIALAILGEIATFTIPKIISSQQNGSYNAKSKEVAAMFSSAYQLYRLDNTVAATTGVKDLTPYMNYVALDSISSIDDVPGYGSKSCNSPYLCLKLHNGGMIQYNTAENFSTLGTSNVINIMFDPDGVYSGSTTGPSKGIRFFIFVNGRLTSWSGTDSNTRSSESTWNGPFPSRDPSWFSW